MRARSRARRAGVADLPLQPPRADGPVIWLDAADAAAVPRIAALARQLRRDRPRLTVVLTGPGQPSAQAGVVMLPPLVDTPEVNAAFLAHWQPLVAVLAGGPVRPALAEAAASAAVPLIWLEAPEPEIAGGGRWPRLMRRTLLRMQAIHSRDEAALAALRRAGAPTDRLELTGLLELPATPPAANEPERAALSRAIGTRPVWLAAAVTLAELDAVAAAQLEAMRSAHRLLLIAVPEPVTAAAALADRLQSVHGLTVGRRSAEAEIDDDLQVYIADTEGEYGLWYRLAPVAYLGGTLTPTGSLRHPFEAATLGTAIIHGPAGGEAAGVLDMLIQARATRPIASGAELGTAVGDLLAPDRAALLAQAGWMQATAGAAATARAVHAILPIIDAAAGTRP
ncbi:MAG: 3-deoxy-D-manno-octulosonic acid transferase [Gemmobacter sp.]